MYTYKCYYHPKEASVQPCKGCKLPLCVGCCEVEGFCGECNQKRAAVKQLRQLRTVMAAQVNIATTTGRLRAARRQMMEKRGTGSKRRLTPSSSLVRTDAVTGAPIGGSFKAVPAHDRLQTRPLDTSVLHASTQLPPQPPVTPVAPRPVARPARNLEPQPKPRRYNPEGVAYRSVKPQAPAAPARKKTRVNPRQVPASAKSRDTAVAWFWPFLIGIGVGVVLMVGMVLAQPFMKGPAPAQYKPKFSTLSVKEKAAIDKVLKTQVVDTLADVETAPAPVAQAPVQAAYTQAPRPAYIRVNHRQARTYRPQAPKAKRQPTLAESIKFTTVPVATIE